MTRLSTIRQVIGLASWLLLSFAAAGVGAVASLSAWYFLSTALTSRVGSTCMGFWSSVERPVFTHGNCCLVCMETARIS
jgi:hypothetical protein